MRGTIEGPSDRLCDPATPATLDSADMDAPKPLPLALASSSLVPIPAMELPKGRPQLLSWLPSVENAPPTRLVAASKWSPIFPAVSPASSRRHPSQK